MSWVSDMVTVMGMAMDIVMGMVMEVVMDMGTIVDMGTAMVVILHMGTVAGVGAGISLARATVRACVSLNLYRCSRIPES